MKLLSFSPCFLLFVFLVSITTKAQMADLDYNITVEDSSVYAPHYTEERLRQILVDRLNRFREKLTEENIGSLFADPSKAKRFLPDVRKMRDILHKIPIIIRILQDRGIAPDQYLAWAGEDDPDDPKNVNFTIKIMQFFALHNALEEKSKTEAMDQAALDGIDAFIDNVLIHELMHGKFMREDELQNIRNNADKIVDGLMTDPIVLEQATRIFSELEPEGFAAGSGVLDGYRGTQIDIDNGYSERGSLIKGVDLIINMMLTDPGQFAIGGEYYLLRPSHTDLDEIFAKYMDDPQAAKALAQLRQNADGVQNSMLSHYLIGDAYWSYLETDKFTGKLKVLFWGQVIPLVINQELVSINSRLKGISTLNPDKIRQLRQVVSGFKDDWELYMEGEHSENLFVNNPYLNDPLRGIQKRYAREIREFDKLIGNIQANAANTQGDHLLPHTQQERAQEPETNVRRRCIDRLNELIQ